MATKEQLRKLRQKYGLGEFKNKKRVSHSRKARQYMARRKHARKSSYRGATTGLVATAIGVTGYVVYENYLAPMIPISGTVRTVAELGVSYWLSSRGGILGNVGKAGVVLTTYKLINGVILPMIGGSATSSSSLFAG